MRQVQINYKKQKGVSLIVTLIMMVVMMLIGASLYNSVDSNLALVNNISMKNASLSAAEAGIDAAVKYLNDNPATLDTHNLANGYYASSPDVPLDDATPAESIDFTGLTTINTTTDDVLWESGSKVLYTAKKLPALVNGFKVGYIIHRMCSVSGTFSASSAIRCATSGSTSTNVVGQYAGGSDYGSYGIEGNTRIMYRITARAWDKSNASSYAQTKILIEY